MRFFFLFPINIGALANMGALMIGLTGLMILSLLVYFEAYLGYIILAAGAYLLYRFCIMLNRVGRARMEREEKERQQ
jgi:hypothetical protein